MTARACCECGEQFTPEGRQRKCDDCKKTTSRALDARKYVGKGKPPKPRVQLPHRASVLERFMNKVEKDPKSGCWLWLGALNRRGAGYPQLDVDGKTVRAHRWAYEHFVGPIPDKQTIDHSCETTRCVNPEHLVVMSRGENARRGRARQPAHTGPPAKPKPARKCGCGAELAKYQRRCENCKAAAKPVQNSVARVKEREALQLRASGLTFDEIAERLGYANASGAWRAYQRAMAATSSPDMTQADRRNLELHRIDLVLNGLWEQASRGDLAAVDRFERLSKLRVKIEGLAVAARGSWDDEDHEPDGESGSGSVVGSSRLEQLREKREREAAERHPG